MDFSNNTQDNDINFQGKEKSDIIAGRNPVMEAVKSKRPIDKVLVANTEKPSGTIAAILGICKKRGIVIKNVSPKKLDGMCGNNNHQGVVALATPKDYNTLDDILSLAEEKGEDPFIVIVNQVEDPHNLGAIIRTAECAGAHGVVIPERRSASMTTTVARSSAGAIEYMNVVRVNNLSSFIDDLKDKGFWIYGADMDGQTWCGQDLKGKIALVIGSEDKGLGTLVKEKCDVILSLPVLGKVNSLNASVAGGIMMYEIARQRLGIKAK